MCGNEEAHPWGKLVNVVESIYTTRAAPVPACPVITHFNGLKQLSEFAKYDEEDFNDTAAYCSRGGGTP